jgi:integrase
MGAIKLSDAVVVALVCPAGKKDVMFFDAALKGFGIRITISGRRLFLFQYRIAGAIRRHRLGEWPTTTTAQARKAAEKHRAGVGDGGDPVAEQRAKHAAQIAGERAARASAKADAFTFGKLIDEWRTRGLAHRKPSYAKDATGRLRNYFPSWAERPAGSITRAEAIEAIDRAEKERGMISARRAMAYARAAYGWAEKRNLLEGNPFRGMAAPGKETTRDRVLSPAELGAIWHASGDLGAVASVYIRALLLTLQRREEVAGMQWEELGPDLAVWTIPAARAKNGRVHAVHLVEPLRALLAALPRFASNPHVFAGRRGNHIGGFSTIKVELISLSAKAAADGHGTALGDDWRFHDFRRTGVTVLANSGVAPHVADRLLNHVTGAIQGVAAVYQRAEFLTERKAALEAWAGFVTSLGSANAA